MHRWLVRAIVALVILVGAGGTALILPPVQADVLASRQDPHNITVYVTRTGEKYHRDGCRYLRQSRIPMSLAQAAKMYGPCSVCKPPVLR